MATIVHTASDVRVESEHDGALAAKIKRKLALLVILGAIGVVATFIVAVVVGMPAATEAVKEEMTKVELNNMAQMTSTKATFATEVLERVQSDLALIDSFSTAALAGGPVATPGASTAGIAVQGGFTSCQLSSGFYGTTLSQSACNAATQCTWEWTDGGKCEGIPSWDHSSYYLPGRAGANFAQTTPGVPPSSLPAHTTDLLGKISALDMAFRSLQEQYGTGGTLLYYGLEDAAPGETGAASGEAIYVVYPGEDMTAYTTWGARQEREGSPKYCDPRWTPAPGSAAASWPSRASPPDVVRKYGAGRQRKAAWYDPRCRGWYQDARAAGGVIFTSPYVSAGGASLGMLVMTAAAPIYHDVAKTMFAGVVAIDFSLADLDQSILINGRIALTDDAEDDGYSYVMAATDGGAVIHPLLDRAGGAMRVVDLEMDQAENREEWTAYNTIAASEIQKGCTGSKEYSKNDGEKWIMAFAGERAVGTADCTDHGYGYSIVMTIAEKSIHMPFQELLVAIWGRLIIAIVVLSCILFLGTCVMGCVAVRVASGTVKPIQNLTGLVTRLNNRDSHLHASDVDLRADSPEMVAMLSAFQKMVVVVSASNAKLGEGLYDEALESFDAALALFEGMGNNRGIGIIA